MKEATGELNSSVIVVSAVALLAAFFFSYIWPMIRTNIQNEDRCSDAICDVGVNKNYMAYCYAPGDRSRVFECPFKG